MTLFILTETSAGYALLKARDKKLLKRDDIAEQGSTAQGVCDMLKLRKFQKFDSAAVALEEAASVQEGKVTPMLSKLLDDIKEETKVSLAVADPKLGNAIKKLPQLQIKPVSDSTTTDLYRAIRGNLSSLIPGLMPDDINTMSLGLSHSLSRHRLKFSPDKVDTMIIHAISLLDELDKELNTYAMRVKEWYGWHFPEMAKIINDNMAYARVILKIGYRTNATNVDLEEVLPEEIEAAIKVAAEMSMGTDITDDDLDNIKMLATQVVELCEYRTQLSSYLTTRMQAIAPNLTALVGELVGARLIANCGSLMNLAKSPASTIQILGAEKALFRALKSKHDTPKYGLIYHASLVGQATGKNKGKIARILAAKTALGLRMDSLSDWGVSGKNEHAEPTDEEKTSMALDNRLKIERRLRALEGKPLIPRGVKIGPSGQTQPAKFELKEARKYNQDADAVTGSKRQASDDSGDDKENEQHTQKKSKMIEEVGEEAEANGGQDESDSDSEMEDESPAAAAPNARAMTNGHSRDQSDKAQEKAEKAARKAARAAKREAKEAKKELKAAKKASKDAKPSNGAVDSKSKRKHEDVDGADGERKKKKKKHQSS